MTALFIGSDRIIEIIEFTSYTVDKERRYRKHVVYISYNRKRCLKTIKRYTRHSFQGKANCRKNEIRASLKAVRYNHFGKKKREILTRHIGTNVLQLLLLLHLQPTT